MNKATNHSSLKGPGMSFKISSVAVCRLNLRLSKFSLIIFIPNSFTPNNDGKNDFFIPINLDQYPNPSIMIYNRWGQLVYENENYQNNWDGSHYLSGEQLNEGLYYYFINPESEKFDYKDININYSGIIGQVQIIRD